jgi:hypothetical protein
MDDSWMMVYGMLLLDSISSEGNMTASHDSQARIDYTSLRIEGNREHAAANRTLR